MKNKIFDYFVMFEVTFCSILLIYMISYEEKTEVIGQTLTLNRPNIMEIEEIEEIKEIEEIDNTEERPPFIEKTIVEEIVEETIAQVEEQPVSTPIIYENYNVTDTNFEVARQVVDYALQFVGNSYVYGGNSLTDGTDCSGFTMLVYANFGVSLPRTAYDQGYVGRYVPLENIQIGDLVLYGYDGLISHAAMYIGDGQVVHALNSNDGIVVTSYTIMPIITVRRVL